MEYAEKLYIEALIGNELKRVIDKYNLYKNDQECYGAIKEEIEEADEEMQILKDNLGEYWKNIRADEPDSVSIMENIERHAFELIVEAVQIAACARKWQRGDMTRWLEHQKRKR